MSVLQIDTLADTTNLPPDMYGADSLASNFRKETSMTKVNVVALMKKVEFYEGLRKFIVDVLVDVLSGVILKLISGGAPGLQRTPEWADAAS